MKLTLVVVGLLPRHLSNAFRTPTALGIPQHVLRRDTVSCSSMQTSADGWVALPVDPAAGERSRTVSFSPSGLEDIRRVEKILAKEQVGDACVVVVPSWRHHLLQYDGLAAALEALNIPTAVSPLPDGLWAFLLQRLQVHALRRAARNGTLKLTVVDALSPLFARLDVMLRQHSDRNRGRRIAVIASDDSAWLVRAFVNSRSTQWLTEIPLQAAVFVGGYHKSIVGELALDVYSHRLRTNASAEGSSSHGERAVKFYNLNGREGGRVETVGEAIGLEASISCLSFEEDSESCVLQEYEVEDRGWLSLLGSTSLLSLWIPRVLRCDRSIC